MLRPSGQRKMPPRAWALRGISFQPSVFCMPLSRWTIRSPPTPVPYSFQQRQRAKRRLLKGILGASLSQVSQSRFSGERSGGGGYSQAPVGSLRPRVSSTISTSPITPSLVKVAGFGAEDGADALRTDLYDAAILLRGGDHLETLFGGVGHGLLAVDVFAGVASVDDHAFVPEIGDGGDDAIDVFAVEKVLVVAADGEAGIVGDFAGESVAAVV